jgi:hypothetical protein
MEEKPKIVLIKEIETIVKPGEDATHVSEIYTDDPSITQEEVISDLGEMGMEVRPHQEDAVGEALTRRGFGLSRKAKENWDNIDWGHN